MTLRSLSIRFQSRRYHPTLIQWGLLAVLLIVITVIGFAGFYAYSDSDMVVRAVEWARDIVGPRPVAIAEELVFKIEDWYYNLNYRLTGNASTWQFAAPTSEPAIRLNATKVSQVQQGAATGLKIVNTGPTLTAATTFTPPPPLAPILHDRTFPKEGQWQPLATAGQPADQPPILWSTFIRPDPERPYAQAGLVAMDLSRSRLHLMIGTKEPESSTANFAPRPGMIPPEVQASGALLAAWNGGFRAMHGHYGMMSDGVTWLPAQAGMATMAIKRDGQVIIGAWGRGVTPAMDLLAWRQNNPPLIENGVVNPDVHAITNLKEWGVTIGNKAVTWRSGLGLTQDGRWLIYAAGNSLSTETLMAALQAAGAYNAMQTDINNPYDRFDTYTAVAQQEQVNNEPVTLPLTAQKLIDQMKGGPDQFLVPYERDFFYLTSQATPAKRAPAPSLLALWQSMTGSNKLISLGTGLG
jgi:hypothetical protein